jgi:hypothetical protein
MELTMRRSILLLTTAAAALTATTGSASAAVGHACQVNGAAGGCPAALNIPVGADLIGTDAGPGGADDFQFVGPGNVMRCSFATIKGVLTDAGGPAYPIGGAGPKGFSTGASLTGPGGTACNGVVGGAAASGSVTLLESNGAAPGLVDMQGTWVPGANAARLTLRAPIFRLREWRSTTTIAECTYRGGSFTGAVTNNALGRVSFVAQPVVKLAGPAICPPNATITVPFHVRWALGIGSGPLRISA